MMKRILNHIVKVLFCLTATISFFSCRNDHCNELMFAPTNLFFYSEVDTSVTVGPYALYIQGVGVDSVIDASEKSMVQIALDNSKENCRFAFAVISEHSLTDTLYFNEDSYRVVGEGVDQSYSSCEKLGNAYFFEGDFNSMRIFDRELDSAVYLMTRASVDTLVIDYSNRVDFVSAECGCLTTHKLKNIKFLHNGIGTVVVEDSTVTNLIDAKNVKIYLENY